MTFLLENIDCTWLSGMKRKHACIKQTSLICVFVLMTFDQGTGTVSKELSTYSET